MKIGIIAQARMGSERLPGKVMKKIDDENPVLFYVINQLKFCKLVNNIIIATSTLVDDDIIEQFSKSNGVKCFRGSESDVLDRYYQCAKKFSLSIIVRITCDDPLIDPTIVDQAIEKFNSNSVDFVTNRLYRTFPFGTEVDVFSFQALEKAWQIAKQPSEREHVIPYFFNNPDKFRISNITHSPNLAYLRWTVDRITDLEFVREMVVRIKKRPILMNDILQILAKEPELKKINSENIPDEGFLKSLKDTMQNTM